MSPVLDPAAVSEWLKLIASSTKSSPFVAVDLPEGFARVFDLSSEESTRLVVKEKPDPSVEDMPESLVDSSMLRFRRGIYEKSSLPVSACLLSS